MSILTADLEVQMERFAGDDIAQMKLAASEQARAELADALVAVRRSVSETGLDVEAVDEAIAAARHS